MGKKLKTLFGVLLSFALLVGPIPINAFAQETEYKFLNPLGTVEPRRDTPLADRQKIIDILEGTGTRTLRLGVAWYYKPLDAEPPYALAEMLKEKWESDYPPGLTVRLVIPDPNA